MYIPGAQSFSYTLNRQGYDALVATLLSWNHTVDAPGHLEQLKRRFSDQLETLDFAYTEKSNRYWHPLQNLARADKQVFWAPLLPFDYDAVACAPTVLLQLARRTGLPAVLLDPIQAYIAGRTALRLRLAQDLDIPVQDAKRLINSLFNGARLSANAHCAAYRTLDYDLVKMSRLQNLKWVRMLRLSVKLAWRHIQLVTRAETKTSKQKWGIYFAAERKILDAARNYLTQTNNPHFCEHDGFKTKNPVELDKLSEFIKLNTGFEIDYDTHTTTHAHSSNDFTNRAVPAASSFVKPYSAAQLFEVLYPHLIDPPERHLVATG